MRRLWLAFTLALFLLPNPTRTEACGYVAFSDVTEDREPALRALLRDESLPLLAPEWHSELWAIAWARLHGKRFSDAEVSSLVDDPHWLRTRGGGEAVVAAIEVWSNARARVTPGTVAIDRGPAVHVEPYRPGPHYVYWLVCGPDTFLTAAATLADRAARLPPDEVAAWVRAQDQVFALCSNAERPQPEALNVGSELARFDRLYQRAAAAELAGEPDATARFDAIAASTSPWADLARYRAALHRVRAVADDDAARASLATRLRAELAITRDEKARRGYGQLLDRVALFYRPAEEVVRTLSTRLLAEDLRADLPRVLRDLVHFAKRTSGCALDLPSLLKRCGVMAPLEAAPAAPSSDTAAAPSSDTAAAPSSDLHARALLDLRTRSGAVIPPHPLLEVPRAFAEAGRVLSMSTTRSRELRLVTTGLLRTTRDSPRATRDAAEAYALVAATRARDVIAHAVRASVDGPTVHADGAEALRMLSRRDWDRLARTLPEGSALRARLRREAFVRAVLLDEVSDASARAAEIARGSDPLATEVRAVLEGPTTDRRLGFLLAVVRADPDEMSVVDELGTHYGTTQSDGCTFGTCEATHPHLPPIGRVDHSLPARTPSAERRRLGTRLVALGRTVTAAVDASPTDARAPELLHRFVRLTRRASVHGHHDPAMGPLSRRSFERLHRDYPSSPWTAQTRHWYR
ncbi:MAG: hypothetical protein H6720_28975 [Sandaracinus sp.]|nr:hypothetical protein [Sandaracinus sp.]